MYKKSPQGWLKHWDFILLDIICLQLAFVVAYFARQGFDNPYSDRVYRTVAFVFVLCQIAVMFLSQSYQGILKRGYYIEFTKTAKHVLMVMLLSVFYLFVTQQGTIYSRLTFSIQHFCIYALAILEESGVRNMSSEKMLPARKRNLW